MLRKVWMCGWLVAVLATWPGADAARAQTAGSGQPWIARYLHRLPAGELVAGADAYGAIRADLPVAPVLRDGETVAWAFLTSDFVGTTGYSGKPIHVLAAVGGDARIAGAALVDHSEPIVLVGIPESEMRALTARFTGLDLAAVAAGEEREPDIIAGATVTVVVIDDSIIRSGLRVARRLGLGWLAPESRPAGPRRTLAEGTGAADDWATLLGDGSVRRLSLDVGQVNAAFAATGDARAAAHPEPGPEDGVFLDLYAAPVTAPDIGRSLLGDAEYANLRNWLGDDSHAVLIAGRGRYSFKGSGYVRGGIFDRIHLVQGEESFRFRDRQHRRIGSIQAAGAPTLSEIGLFRIPADAGFDPAAPWRLQLLVQRAVGALDRSYLTFDLAYRIPDRYLAPLAADAPQVSFAEAEAEARQALWKRVWMQRMPEIAVLLAMLLVLTGAFFFQASLTRHARLTFWFRIGFLTLTLLFLGWYAGAQLSVVNLMALVGALTSEFSWDAFLLDPLVFLLWFSVAASLVLWGRGPFCGWLCPFGALQELLNRLARLARIPQWTVPWGLHERLWPVKYVLFLGLFGLSLYSLELAERAAEIEPFKTAIVLKFQRSWPFVLFVVVLLGAGLFVERFYCRYLCPLGAALAIPARIRNMDWLKRYRECGNPCQRCAQECMVQAIHPEGRINPNECLYCLHCQVLYQDQCKCPVVIRKIRRRQDLQRRNAGAAAAAIPAATPR